MMINGKSIAHLTQAFATKFDVTVIISFAIERRQKRKPVKREVADETVGKPCVMMRDNLLEPLVLGFEIRSIKYLCIITLIITISFIITVIIIRSHHD